MLTCIFVEMNICGTEYLWYWIFVVLKICGTEYLWYWIFVVLNMCGTEYLWYWIFVGLNICGNTYFCQLYCKSAFRSYKLTSGSIYLWCTGLGVCKYQSSIEMFPWSIFYDNLFIHVSIYFFQRSYFQIICHQSSPI